MAEKEKFSAAKVVVVVRKGLVTQLLTDTPGIEVAVVDLDVSHPAIPSVASVTHEDGETVVGSMNRIAATVAPKATEAYHGKALLHCERANQIRWRDVIPTCGNA